jgi:hypothetical protein
LAPVPMTATVPVKLPGVVRTDVFNETARGTAALPVMPEVGLTDSHEPPDMVAGVAVKLTPEVPPMLTICAGGAVVPSCQAKFRIKGLAEIVGVLDTSRVTGTDTEVAPVAWSVIVPLSVPAVVRLNVLTETLMELELDMVTFTAFVAPFNSSHAPPDGVAVT